LKATANAGLQKLDELEREGKYPPEVLQLHRLRLQARLAEFAGGEATKAARKTAAFRRAQREIIAVERTKLIALRNHGTIDNTVLRRLQRVFDLESVELQVLDTTGHLELQD
jgi:hypothetical protein